MASGVIKEINPSHTLGTAVSLVNYTSSNKYTAPRDGYAIASVWANDTTVSVHFDGKLEISLSYSKQPTLCLFVKRGLQVWTDINGSNRSVNFYPIN